MNSSFVKLISSVSPFESLLITVAVIVFIFGLIGNALVVLCVLRNSYMRNITNILIVNNAIGDFLIIFICLPFSLVQDITQNWIFSETMCKFTIYVQYVSVCVSVMTLTAISLERYHALVYPLKFKSKIFRVRLLLVVIWAASLLINLPHPIVIQKETDSELDVSFCYPSWDIKYQIVFDLTLFILIYLIPMLLIGYCYTKVCLVLWRVDKNLEGAGNATCLTSGDAVGHRKDHSTGQHESDEHNSAPSPVIPMILRGGSTVNSVNLRSRLLNRRKAAKMLIVMTSLFIVCFIPVHTLSFMRYATPDLLYEILSSLAKIKAAFQISHMLVYINSSVNPVIYYIMSDNFRREFKNLLVCRKVCRK